MSFLISPSPAKYTTPQTRALSSITVESYQKVYSDQAKFLSKLAGDVSFLAASDKQQQQGIDKANENVIQQLQGMIDDIITLLGGGGDTGLDFRDLRYVLIAIGDLLGFTVSQDGSGGISIPINVFSLAWHLFSEYIFPTDNFRDVFDYLIDTSIATLLSLFGTDPIAGQAIEQLAVILSTFRDQIDPLLDAIQGLFNLFGIVVSPSLDIPAWLQFWTPFKPIFDMLGQVFGPYISLGLDQFVGTLGIIITWTGPFLQDLTFGIEVITGIIENLNLTGKTVAQISTWVSNAWAMFGQINFLLDEFSPLTAWIQIAQTLLIPAGLLSSNALDGFVQLVGAENLSGVANVINRALGTALNTQGQIQSIQLIIRTITQSIQSFIDGIANALKQVGSNFLAGDVIGFLTTSLQNITTTGEFLAQYVTGLLLPDVVPNLTVDWDGVIDPTKVIGVLGFPTISDAVQQTIDVSSQAIGVIAAGFESSLSSWQIGLNNLATQLGFNPLGGPPPPVSVAGQAQSATNNLANRATQKSIGNNLDPSVDSTFNFSDIWSLDPLPTIPITQTKSVIGYITVRDGGLKKAICWKGFGTSDLTSFVVNMSTVDSQTAISTKVYTSPNILGDVAGGTDPAWNYLNLDSAYFQDTKQGDLYKIEIQVLGPGTYHLVGQTLSSQLAQHPTSKPALPGAARTKLMLPELTNSGSLMGNNPHNLGSKNPGTHTFGPDDTCLVIVTNMQKANSSLTFSVTGTGISETYIPAQSIDQFYVYANQIAWQNEICALMIPASWRGQTVTITAHQNGGTLWNWSARSFSFKNVSGFTAPVATNWSSNWTPTQTVTANPNELVIQHVGSTFNNNAKITTGLNANQTLVWQYDDPVDSYEYQNWFSTQPGPSTVGGTVTFSATIPTGASHFDGGYFGQIAMRLQGIIGPASTTTSEPGSAGSPEVYSNATPWLGLAGVVGQTIYPPDLTTFNTVGSNQTYNKPTWADWYDVIVFGGGGGGQSGASLVAGLNGGCGNCTAIRVTAEQANSADTFTVNVGPGGASYPVIGGAGSNGGSSSVYIPGYGTITAYGGPGGNSGAASPTGLAGTPEPNKLFNGFLYPGGAGGGSPQAGGAQPGGGGASGNAQYLMSYVWGGPGGAGAVYIMAGQNV